ncbi:MAG: hypothetical protein ACW9XH_06725 [Candidatus Nitrosopumilus sp. bin_32a]
MKQLIERFNSVNSLKVNLEKEIEDTKNQIQEYSNMLGEKIRINEKLSADDPDFLALKAKFEVGSSDKKSDDKKSDDKKSDDKKSDDKKSDDKRLKEKSAELKKLVDRKKKGKKGISDKWYDLNEILVYNGIGLKGELELYFKAVDELKSKLENFQRTLSTLNTVIEKGLKEDMGCIAFRGAEGLLEISFLKSAGTRENFTLKSIYTGKAIPVENTIKIGV